MNSKELIGNVREKFDTLNEDKETFEESVQWIIKYWIERKKLLEDQFQCDVSNILEVEMKRELPDQLSRYNNHQRSFYNGWIEGRADLIKD